MKWLRVGGSSAFRYTEKRCVRWSHFELREYDPIIGRWLSPDPAEQHWSPYLAMGNNPVNYADPDGGTDGPITFKHGDCKCSYVDDGGNRISEYSNVIDLTVLRYYAGFNFGVAYDEFVKSTDNLIKDLVDPLYAKSFKQLQKELSEVIPVLGQGSLITEEQMSADRYSPSNEQLVSGTLPILISKRQWKLTPNGASQMKVHNKFGTFYKSKTDGTWWTKDNAQHGGSHFKVYEEGKKGLNWIRDADEFGNYIFNKHKGSTGVFIPWGQLKAVK